VIRDCVCADFPWDIFMAQRPAIHFSDGYAPRGLALAERRLAYLAELYDSGRWRRFYGDADFLLMVRDARTAVESWRRLVRAAPADTWKPASPIVVEDEATTLAPLAASIARDAEPRRTSSQVDVATDSAFDWRVRGTRLPPVAFSAHGIAAEGDLTEA
jgi:uncharacterized repeat protein (TIGR03809 family)